MELVTEPAVLVLDEPTSGGWGAAAAGGWAAACRLAARLHQPAGFLSTPSCRNPCTFCLPPLLRSLQSSSGHLCSIPPNCPSLQTPAGLDSYTALHLMRTLKEVAGGGRIVLLTFHQPSPAMFSLLDRAYLMAQVL